MRGGELAPNPQPYWHSSRRHTQAGQAPTAETVLFEGSVRQLCPQAPNNVNTMACAAMAAHTLGFDGTVGRLVADARLTTHEIEIEALGKVRALCTCSVCYC